MTATVASIGMLPAALATGVGTDEAQDPSRCGILNGLAGAAQADASRTASHVGHVHKRRAKAPAEARD